KQIVAEARWLVYAAAGVFGISLIAGLTYMWSARGARGLPSGDQTSWALLVSMTTLIAAIVVLAVACLRGSEAGALAVLGIREPLADEQTAADSGDKQPAATPLVDWATQLSPRGVETRIGDNLKYII